MWPALISGGMSLIGGIMGANQSAANTAAQQQMQLQSEQWQEHMSNTAYQRSSADMQAAGLNPMMMFGSGGGPASTPSPVVQPTPQTKSPFENLGSIAKDMIGTAIQQKTLEKMTDEISNLQATRNEIVARTATEQQRPDLVKQQANLTAQEFVHEGVKTDIASKDAANRAQAMKEMWDNPVTRKILQGGVLGSSAADIIKPGLDLVGGVTNSALKSALLKKYGNASDMSGSATSWRRGYDAGRNEE